jgi:hypothetical protein
LPFNTSSCGQNKHNLQQNREKQITLVDDWTAWFLLPPI